MHDWHDFEDWKQITTNLTVAEGQLFAFDALLERLRMRIAAASWIVFALALAAFTLALPMLLHMVRSMSMPAQPAPLIATAPLQAQTQAGPPGAAARTAQTRSAALNAPAQMTSPVPMAESAAQYATPAWLDWVPALLLLCLFAMASTLVYLHRLRELRADVALSRAAQERARRLVLNRDLLNGEASKWLSPKST
ncbi:hypothetical protein V8J88_00990 [Massilia sp. W12]|uniref:hypothetical protein n=1 Tax=Massilia sp. W12 TaxID=3126507 RepID=UPI0030D013FA